MKIAGSVLLAALILFAGCATDTPVKFPSRTGAFGGWEEGGVERYKPSSEVSPDTDFIPQWESLFDGIDLAKSTKKNPPLAVYCVRVDLSSPRIKVVISGGSRDPDNPDCEYKGKRTSMFLKETGCVVAVNGTPFTPYVFKEGACVNIRGLSISKGISYSETHFGYGFMLVTKDGKASIGYASSDNPEIEYALEGYPWILEYGGYRPRSCDRAPRTAVGVSEDGRYLFLLVIDGRKDKYSVGVAYNEIAEWLMMHGAFNGINLDGGGSSTLVIAGRGGEPVIVNRYSDPTERVVANHIGIMLTEE